MQHAHCTKTIRQPWNKGKLVGQKAPLKLKEIWSIRVRLQLASRHRDLALFNLAIDAARPLYLRKDGLRFGPPNKCLVHQLDRGLG